MAQSLKKPLSKLYRNITSSWRRLPDFLVIGTVKGGTTSLYKYISQHQSILPATKKEVHFFADRFRHKKTIDWYRTHFPLKVLLHKSKKLTGEASPEYFHSYYAPSRIYHYLPNCKLILLLRNPIDRAYSHYCMRVRLGKEKRSFEEALIWELKRCEQIFPLVKANPDLLPSELPSIPKPGLIYVSSSVYYFSLRHWLKIFPRQQMLVISSEEMFSNPNLTMKKVFDFLQVPSVSKSKPNYSVYNQGTYGELNDTLKTHLDNFFNPYNQLLKEEFNIDFRWHS